jgi:hypothetical protein
MRTRAAGLLCADIASFTPAPAPAPDDDDLPFDPDPDFDLLADFDFPAILIDDCEVVVESCLVV